MRSKQLWPAAFAVALVLIPAGEAEGRTRSEKCRPATIEVTSPWRPARGPEYVTSFGDFTPDFEVEPDERWEQLGEHRTDAILEVDTEVETRCHPNTCRTCVTTISARIGFTPSEIRLHENLRRNRCARKLTDAARKAARRHHPQSSGDGGERGETQSSVGKVPARGTRDSRKRAESRSGRDHSQGQRRACAGPRESHGVCGCGERAPRPAGPIPA